MSELIKPLLRTPQPLAGESYRGYILRLSAANLCADPALLFMHAGMARGDTRAPIQPTVLLATLTARNVDAYRNITYESESMPQWFRSISGHQISKFSLNLKRPKICIECIQELGYIPSRWDLRVMNVCHLHKRMLIKVCSKCEKKLNWFRPGLLICKCNSVITDKGEVEESAALLDLMKVVSSVIDRKPLLDSDSSSGMPFAGFTAMPLVELLCLIDFAGDKQIRIDGSKSKFGLKGNDDLLGVSRKAAYVFSNWPNNFYKVFEENQVFRSLDPRTSESKSFKYSFL